MDINKIPQRSELREEYKWDLTDLYKSDQAWQEDFDKLRELASKLPDYKGRLGSSAAVLLEYTKLEEQAGLMLENLANYAQRKSDEDTRVPEYQAMTAKITSLWVDISAQCAFETPEIMAIPDDTLEQFYKDEPDLELYRRSFWNLRRRREHILSDPEERLLAQAGEMAQAPDNIYSMFNDADLTFADAVDSSGQAHPLSQGTFASCEESYDRVLRKSAFENLYAGYDAFKNTIAAILASQMRQLKFFAQARRYPSSLDMALDGTNVPVQVYTNLIDTVNGNLDKMHRYVRLRKKLLNLPELHMYDVYAPLIKKEKRHISFEEAKETVASALAIMGDKYISILRQGYEGRWIDVYENVGKRSGAYSAGARVHPYVLLNYNGTLDSVFTLAHEMGHAIHSYLSTENQPIPYSDYVIFVAEVASTVNETLLMYYLLDNTTDKHQRAELINHFLEQFKGTLYRQTMFAQFELQLGRRCEAGESLTAQDMCTMYRKLNQDYFGPDMVLDQQIDLEWARIPHFYYDYYVFQYATGFSAAIALANRIRSQGASAVADYLGFLSGGCSKDPIDLLKGAGVDMTTPAPIQSALDLFDDLIGQMESLAGEL